MPLFAITVLCVTCFRHTKAGILTMPNTGTHTNTSVFCITIDKMPQLGMALRSHMRSCTHPCSQETASLSLCFNHQPLTLYTMLQTAATSPLESLCQGKKPSTPFPSSSTWTASHCRTSSSKTAACWRDMLSPLPY